MNIPGIANCIAERELSYSMIGRTERSKLMIRIYAPYKVQQSKVNFKAQEGTAGCRWEVDGLPEQLGDTTYGADSLQALQLALNIDGVLRSLRHKYAFYFRDGESYFED